MAGNDHLTDDDAGEIAESEARSRSWLDEFWSFVIAAPMIAAFVPGAQDFVSRGFKIISTDAPGWYLGFVGMAATIAFGKRAVPGLFPLQSGRKV